MSVITRVTPVRAKPTISCVALMKPRLRLVHQSLGPNRKILVDFVAMRFVVLGHPTIHIVEKRVVIPLLFEFENTQGKRLADPTDTRAHAAGPIRRHRRHPAYPR